MIIQKSLWSLIPMILLTSSAGFAGECRLKSPIPLHGALPGNFVLHNVILNEVPKFEKPESYVPGKNSLELATFPVQFDETPTGYIGARVGISGVLESVGVSNDYSGSFHLSGGSTLENGEETFNFEMIEHFDGAIENNCPRHAAGDAITRSRVIVTHGMLISISLTIPVFQHWACAPSDGLGEYVAFTGENQELCLVSAAW